MTRGGGQSSDPNRRARQLGNLKRGGTVGPGRPPTHGAYAQVTAAELDGKTRDLFDAMAADAPLRAADGGLPAHDTLVVRMLAEVLVRRERVRVTELRQGLETPDGRIRGVVEYGLRLDGQALDLARELGLTPSARLKLGLDLVKAQRHVDLAQEWSNDAVDGTASGDE